MATGSDVLVVGTDSPLLAGIIDRLAGDGYKARGVGGAAALHPRLRNPYALVIVPGAAMPAPLDATSVEEFVGALDAALVGASGIAKAVFCKRSRKGPGRIVLVAGWAVVGLAEQTTGAAVMGAILGLARSWALELAPADVTVNAVVAGEGGDADVAEGVANAVAFFLDGRSAAVTGQVVSVCGGRTPGTLPL